MDLGSDEFSLKVESILDYNENSEMEDVILFEILYDNENIPNTNNYSSEQMTKNVNFTWTPRNKCCTVKTIQRFFL